MANLLPNNANNNPYGISQTQNKYESQADTLPPQYASLLNSDGQLKTPYTVDPNQSHAFQQMAGIAEGADLSPWAQMQMQQNTLATQTQRDQSNAQAQGSTDQAMQQLMTTGGGSTGGSAAFLANQGARNAMMANQNIGAQSQQNALGIQATDAQNKQTLLGQVANTETGAQTGNAQAAMQDTQNANLFNANRYQQQMAAWGAANTADAQTAAAQQSGGKK